jgi:hypothetical protein
LEKYKTKSKREEHLVRYNPDRSGKPNQKQCSGVIDISNPGFKHESVEDKGSKAGGLAPV